MKLKSEAIAFCISESKIQNNSLFGVTYGKAVGTYIEHKFKEQLSSIYLTTIGSSANGIDLSSENILTDIKVTSIKQPQSSCPFKDVKQKIYGLGYNLLIFVYDKIDDSKTQSTKLDFVSCSFISKERTGDYSTTLRLREMIKDKANVEDIIAYLSDKNIPQKSNIKNLNGLDSITGKGNFDIAEYITLRLIESFQNLNCFLALLVKNAVIKNILYDQKVKKLRIGKIEKYCIDSKKEFNVSVEASFLYCQFNLMPSFSCTEYDFYNLKNKLCFGWFQNKFVSNYNDYNKTKDFDGICQFEWRQGIKHDCASIMELESINDYFVNNQVDKIKIEPDLIYGFLKSSDLKNTVIKKTRKHTIVTQTKVGQDTTYLKHLYPKTYSYLEKNIFSFQSRKSSIYKGKPLFSIFGIGDYAFKPFKVAISGLYKTYHFTLVLPQNYKPVMLDDTCYFIGFDNIEFAVFAIILLNSSTTEAFLKSITFFDAKRVFTKDLLMRLDLLKIANSLPMTEIEKQLIYLNEKYDIEINISQWGKFLNLLMSKIEKPLTIFAELENICDD
ncbi:MAG: hypothetical protein QM539_02735 [Alphaproteobacteria bacterium]|nr:hypothetical protein [Alphaproteobacteria bacterium]